ncbi:MAG: hypothetical protein KDJ16_11195 [Hyphomicrobiales bacterium]|nr:hypothetical protein [Hyphomicrobiales bacterium]
MGVAAWEEDGGIAIAIGDDGPGIPPSDREAALKRGGRLDQAGQGTGLGLAIVSDIVEAYGGSLDLADAEAGGLLVTIRFPRERRALQ